MSSTIKVSLLDSLYRARKNIERNKDIYMDSEHELLCEYYKKYQEQSKKFQNDKIKTTFNTFKIEKHILSESHNKEDEIILRDYKIDFEVFCNKYNKKFLPNIPQMSAFAKINISQFNNSEYIFTYNTNTEYIYQQQYTDKITELHIQILDYKGNLLNFDSDYNLTLELGIINQNVLENNSLVTFNELEQKLQKIQIVDEGVDKSCISYKINDDKSKALPLINSFGIDDDKSKASSLINSFGIDNLNHTFINDNTETINNDTYDILIDNTSQNVIHDNNYIPQEMNLSSKQEYNSNKKKSQFEGAIFEIIGTGAFGLKNHYPNL